MNREKYLFHFSLTRWCKLQFWCTKEKFFFGLVVYGGNFFACEYENAAKEIATNNKYVEKNAQLSFHFHFAQRKNENLIFPKKKKKIFNLIVGSEYDKQRKKKTEEVECEKKGGQEHTHTHQYTQYTE